jgi:hypothetical protein
MPRNPDDAPSLPERAASLAADIERIVLNGLEHPTHELKRTVTLSKNDLADRLDFVKLVQGLSNSHKDTECIIVIGADEQNRCFVDVTNAASFDAARLSPILRKYLEPEPQFTVFNNMKASTGERYVVLVIHSLQDRPVFAMVQGKSESKLHFSAGDIWIKHQTGLKNATKVDLDLMYAPYIEREAAKRARILFEHLQADLGPKLLSQAADATPVPELLLGSRDRLARFAEAMIANGQGRRFGILIEMARQLLVEQWSAISRTEGGANHEERAALIAAFYKDQFLPSLISVVDLGLQVIRYDGHPSWLRRIANLLSESFQVLSGLRHWENAVIFSAPVIARTAYEVYLGFRTLATYAFRRERPHFAKVLLPIYVKPLSPDPLTDIVMPLLFWPFSGNLGLPEMKTGRNEEYWHQRIGETWGIEAFGSKENFLQAAAQLEFVLELNSYLFTSFSDPRARAIVEQFPEKRLRYIPDFWTEPIDPAFTIALRIFDSLTSESGFPSDLAVEPALTQQIFQAMPLSDRKLFYGEFLSYLQKWQSDAMFQQRRFPFSVTWPERLRDTIIAYKAHLVLPSRPD